MRSELFLANGYEDRSRDPARGREDCGGFAGRGISPGEVTHVAMMLNHKRQQKDGAAVQYAR